jgi:hypothetical protein
MAKSLKNNNLLNSLFLDSYNVDQILSMLQRMPPPKPTAAGRLEYIGQFLDKVMEISKPKIKRRFDNFGHTKKFSLISDSPNVIVASLEEQVTKIITAR